MCQYGITEANSRLIMAKKTKAQKIIAELRRKIKKNQEEDKSLSSSLEKMFSSGDNEKKSGNFYPLPSSLKNEFLTQEKQKDNQLIISYPYEEKTSLLEINLIKKDVFKTLFFAFFILLFEITIYWLLEKGGDSFLLFKKIF